MATKKSPSIASVGAHIENVTIQNTAAPTSEHQSMALAELARAAKANADGIGRIADALRGAEARMEYGIHLSDIRGTS
jgi:hypothetical protein